MRIALYGLGRMGRHHARHLGEMGHEVAVVDPNAGRADSTEGVDAVVVATPTITHGEIALPWLRRGVPVLVEKPITPSADVARELAAFPNCYVGHIERFNPAFAAVAGCDARFVQAERLAPWSDRSTDVDVVFDLMIHDLDLFLSFSNADVREVRANGLSVVSGRIDIVHARVELTDGRVGVLTASRISRKAVRALRVFTPSGYTSCDLRDHVVVRVNGALKEHTEPLEKYDALRAELSAFIAAVSGEGTFPVPASQAVRVIELAEAIRCACT